MWMMTCKIKLHAKSLSVINSKNGIPEVIRNNKDDDKNDPDYQNEELTTARKLLETWKKGNKHLEQFWKV